MRKRECSLICEICLSCRPRLVEGGRLWVPLGTSFVCQFGGRAPPLHGSVVTVSLPTLGVGSHQWLLFITLLNVAERNTWAPTGKKIPKVWRVRVSGPWCRVAAFLPTCDLGHTGVEASSLGIRVWVLMSKIFSFHLLSSLCSLYIIF